MEGRRHHRHHMQKKRENVYMCTHATQHTKVGPHTVSSLFSCLPFVSLSVLFLCRLSPCDVVLCCVWVCMCVWVWCVPRRVLCGVVLLVVVVCVWVWCVPLEVLTCSRGSPKNPLDLTHFKFENRSNTACSRFLQSFALPDENCSTPASVKKQPLDGFDLSFSSRNRV